MYIGLRGQVELSRGIHQVGLNKDTLYTELLADTHHLFVGVLAHVT